MGPCHPDDLPEGYHTGVRGQSTAMPSRYPSRAAHGRPRGRATPGRRDGTQLRAETNVCELLQSQGVSQAGPGESRQ